MRSFSGTPVHLVQSVLARATFVPQPRRTRKDKVLVAREAPQQVEGYAAVIAVDATEGAPGLVAIAPEALEILHEGDIVLLTPEGRAVQMWEAGARDNVLLVTNACNCRCLTCPQPSGPDPDDLLAQNLRLLELVQDTSVPCICLTGGEPTLRPESLLALLRKCKQRFPGTPVSLLTNGRRFADFDFAQQVAGVAHPHLTYGVALQADVASLHDHTMGAVGSFEEAVRGLHHLARLRQRVELRVVLQALNVGRLPSLMEFIYRSFPFVSHVALMGMEVTGRAEQHLDELWVDPVVYAPALHAAVRHLHQRDLRVSVYNLPLCLLPEELWRFCRDSISGWKRAHLEQCQPCGVRADCSGVFATSRKYSAHIGPPRNGEGVLMGGEL